MQLQREITNCGLVTCAKQAASRLERRAAYESGGHGSRTRNWLPSN
jgi:hypothetical protein